MRVIVALVVIMNTLEVMCEVIGATGHWELGKNLAGTALTQADLDAKAVQDNGVLGYIQRACRQLDAVVPNPSEKQQLQVPILAGEYFVDVPNVRSIDRVFVREGSDPDVEYERMPYRSVRHQYEQSNTIPSSLMRRIWSRWMRHLGLPSTTLTYIQNFWPDIDTGVSIGLGLWGLCYDGGILYGVFGDNTANTWHVYGYDSTGTRVFSYTTTNKGSVQFDARGGRRYIATTSVSTSPYVVKLTNVDTGQSLTLRSSSDTVYALGPITVGGNHVFAALRDATHSVNKDDAAFRCPFDLSSKSECVISDVADFTAANSSYMFCQSTGTDATTPYGVFRIPVTSFTTPRQFVYSTPADAIHSYLLGADDSYIYFRYTDINGKYGIFAVDQNGALCGSVFVGDRQPFQRFAPPYLCVYVDSATNTTVSIDTIQMAKRQFQSANPIVISPAPDKDAVATIEGGFYSRTPTDPGDTTWWMDRHPDIVVDYTIAEIENLYHRNASGYRDMLSALAPKIAAVKNSVLMEEQSGADETTRLGYEGEATQLFHGPITGRYYW